MLNYRNAIRDDLDWIVEVYNSTVPAGNVTADTVFVTVESRREWFEAHRSPDRPLWVVENAGREPVGWVSFQSFYGRPAYAATAEISIYLHEQYRKKGYGKAILEHCLEKAPCFGVHTLLGFIFSHNEPSLRLFERAGFEVWGVLPRIALLKGEEKNLTIVGKRIA